MSDEHRHGLPIGSIIIGLLLSAPMFILAGIIDGLAALLFTWALLAAIHVAVFFFARRYVRAGRVEDARMIFMFGFWIALFGLTAVLGAVVELVSALT